MIIMIKREIMHSFFLVDKTLNIYNEGYIVSNASILIDKMTAHIPIHYTAICLPIPPLLLNEVTLEPCMLHSG